MNPMTSELARHIGLAHKVFRQGELVGVTPAQWNALAEDPAFFNALHEVMVGRSEIKPVNLLIDYAADPFCPDGWTVKEHRTVGKLAWHASKVRLHLTDEQKFNSVVKSNALREALSKERVLNANALDILLVNQQYIPEDWKNQVVHFWGTIYYDRNGHSYVRCLYWNETSNRWSSDHSYLGGEWNALGQNPAVLFTN